METQDFAKIMDQSILPYLGRTMKAIDLYISDQLENAGIDITKTQMVLLKVLSKHEHLPQHNLAFLTSRDKTSLTRLIATLEKKEMVHRQASKEDKRVKLISITQKGKDVLKKAQPIMQEATKTIQTGLSLEEIEKTKATLRKIGKNINVDALTVPMNK